MEAKIDNRYPDEWNGTIPVENAEINGYPSKENKKKEPDDRFGDTSNKDKKKEPDDRFRDAGNN